MEVKIRAAVNTLKEVEEIINKIREMEKEHNCTCTLLEIEIVTTL